MRRGRRSEEDPYARAGRTHYGPHCDRPRKARSRDMHCPVRGIPCNGHAGTQGEESCLATAGRNHDEYDNIDCSLDNERSVPRCRRPLSSDRRHRHDDRGRPASARANRDRKLVLHQRRGRRQLATLRARGAPCIGRGRAGTTSRRMRALDARDRPTFPAPCTRGAWWTSARSARARARTQPRRLRDVARSRRDRATCRSRADAVADAPRLGAPTRAA